MATAANKRDVTLGIGIETTGDGAVQRLAAEVRKLASEGGPAAAEFQALADQLDRLGDQVRAVQSLRDLNDDVDRLAVAQQAAAAATKAAKDALEAQSVAAAQLRERQQAAAQAVLDGNIKLKEARGAVRELGAEYDRAGKNTQEYRDRLAALVAAVTAADTELTRRRAAQSAANVETAKAVNEESRLAAAYVRTREASNGADAALRDRATTLRAAQTAAAGLAVSTTDLAQADAQLLDTQARLAAQLKALQAQQAERRALDEQNAAVVQRTEQNVRALASAYDLEQAALAESAAAAAKAAAEKQRLADAAAQVAEAERKAAAAIETANAKRREQQEHDEAAVQTAYRLAEARKAAAVAAQSELLLLKDSEEFTRRYEQAQREAAAAVEREGVEAMRLLEQAARAADKAQEQLTASLRETEAAAERYAAAIGEAAVAGEQDVAAAQKRRAAAEALIASERALTAEQREAAQERDRNRVALVAEAQALLAAARAADESREATARLVRDSRVLGETLDGTGRSVSRIGELTRQAFGTTGVRSLQDIEKEIADVDRATSLLERKFRQGQISADDLARALGSATVRLATLKREAATIPELPGQFERISASIQGTISKFGALGAAIATVGVAVRPVIEATVALDQMRRTLTTVTGSAEVAEQQIDFLRKTAQLSGQQFTEVGQSYAKFAASALQSGLSIQQTQEVFKSVALAAGNLGLSSDQAKRALEALSQIASKGTVSMEELRQQLGDALPGVLPLLAKQLGLTQAELNKVVESGNLLALEAIPAIGRALTALQPQDGVVNGMVATWNRFINVVKQAGTTLVEGPLGSTAGIALKAFGGVLRDVSVIAVSASEAFKLFGLSTLAVFDALTPGGLKLKDLGATLDTFAQQAATNIQKYKEVAYAGAEGAAALAAETDKAGKSFAKLALDQQKLIDSAELAAQSSEKNVQAKKAEGEASITLAGLIGDENEQREAGVVAAQRSAEASRLQAAADEAVVAALIKARDATLERAKAEGLGADATKATIEALDKKIIKATADAEKTRAQADAARAHAEGLDLAARSASNNASQVETLRKRYDEAKLAVEAARLAMVDGTGTFDDVKKATEALAKAKGLLRDAIDDVTEALDRELKAMQADIKLQEAGIKLEIERQKNAIIAANLAGNEYKAKQATLRIKELELQLGNLSVGQKRAEAEATLRAIDTQERELKSLGQLTPEKAAELEARRKVQLAAVLEADAANESAKSKRVEYEELRKGTPAREAHAKATGESTTAIVDNSKANTENTGTLNANSQALTEQQTKLVALTAARKAYIDLLVASRGFEGLGVTGNNGLAGIKEPGLTDVRAPGSRLTDGDLVTESGFGKSPTNLSDVSTALGGAGTFGIDTTVRKGNGQYGAYNEGRNGQRIDAPAGSPFGGGNTAGWRASKRTVNVNLNVGGKTVPMTTSDADADALLRALEKAQRSSGL